MRVGVLLFLVACGAPSGPSAITGEPADLPRDLSRPEPARRRLAAFDGGTCAIDPSGQLWCWGETARVMDSDPSETSRAIRHALDAPVIHVVASGDVRCSIDTHAGVDCADPLVDDLSIYDALAPATDLAPMVEGICAVREREVRCVIGGEIRDVQGADRAIEIASDGLVACARRSDGRVVCFDVPVREDPEDAVPELAAEVVDRLSSIVQVVGGREICALGATGSVACIGADRELRRIAIAPATALFPGEQSMCARVADGGVHCWGANSCGQLHDGSTIDRRQPVEARGLEAFAEVSMGDAHACGLRADGRVACWGCGFDGAVGPGASRTRYEPEVVSRGASRVFATRNHTCVREGAGALACAGGFFRTRAGISASSTFRPLAIEHADRVVDVEETSRGLVVLYDDGEAALLSDGAIGARPIGGGMRALVPNTPGLCALDRAGALSCWDDPYQTETFDLAPVEGIEPGLSAAVGAFGSCVNTASGTLSCVAPSGRRAPTFATAGRVVAIAGEHDLCALFDNRELGCHRSDGTREVAVSHVKAFAMGIGHVCAIVDGDREQVRCAGEGYRGELGTESAVASDFRLVPGLVAPTGDPHFVEIAAGDHHTCVRRIDGAVVCWGADSSGQLGRLPDSFRADPVEVPLE